MDIAFKMIQNQKKKKKNKTCFVITVVGSYTGFGGDG